MVVSTKLYKENECVKIGSYNFEIMEYYTYLGISKSKNKLGPGIEKGITDANRAYSALLLFLMSQPVLGAEEIKLVRH